ncbi:MAG: DUF5818 domain-containing protein [Candidatus Sulfotelmatobacter sp.]
MKKFRDLVRTVFPAVLLIAGLGYLAATAQNSRPNNVVSAQDPMQQPDNQKPATETKTFAGKIVKNGNALVLSDQDGKTTYKLDDQQKAKEFVNQDVKVTGVLDASTGMIRVSAVDPA